MGDKTEKDKASEKPTPESLKELGNQAVKNNSFHEAVLHYTHAIKLEPNNYILFSNRSYAFLMLQQYYFALEDAKETIRQNPQWPKGYFRKAEVEKATGHFVEACASFKEALIRKPEDSKILEDLKQCTRDILKDKKADEQVPWLGSGIGLILGVSMLIADCLFTQKPTNPILMALITVVIAMVGYGIAKSYRYYVKSQRKSLLDAPIDLGSNDDETEEKLDEKTSTPRYTKSQARQRYKKGKLS